MISSPKATEPLAHLETNLTRPPPPCPKNIDNADKKLIPRGIYVLLMCNPLKKIKPPEKCQRKKKFNYPPPPPPLQHLNYSN